MVRIDKKYKMKFIHLDVPTIKNNKIRVVGYYWNIILNR